MSGFEDIKKAQETKFIQEETVSFKIDARRRKLLALWAAEITGMSEEQSLDYAMSIVKYGIEDESPSAVINKIIEDAADRGALIDEDQLRAKNLEFSDLARRQLSENK